MCQKHLGRSPMKHLTFLRIQRATDLLVGTDQTLDLIARSVGYNTASSFSKALPQMDRLVALAITAGSKPILTGWDCGRLAAFFRAALS